MKRCPFCAEEIQDAAIVCKHCGRDLPGMHAAAVSPKKKRGGSARIVLGVLGGVVVLMFIARFISSSNGDFEIAAARGALDLSITSRDRIPLKDCYVKLLDQGGEWTTTDNKSISPSETVSFRWSEFRQNDQPMPGFLARERNNFIVSCILPDGYRHTVGVHF